MDFPITVNAKVSFLTRQDPLGMGVYRNSLVFLLAKAALNVFPGCKLSVEHSFGSGFYCNFEMVCGTQISAKQTRELEEALRNDVKKDLPILRYRLAFEEALAKFASNGHEDKAGLLRYRNPPFVLTHQCGDFFDLAHGPLASHTGVLTDFKLIHYPPGFLIQFPDTQKAARIPAFVDQPHLFKVFHEHKEWGRTIGVSNVAKLNEIIYRGRMADFIRMSEAFHEKKIAHIADQISKRRKQLKIILISGPSAAGKTTFAKRLTVQLQVNGIRASTISLDNYYLNDEDTPRDKDGHPDYEHLHAVDVPLFNQHLLEIIKGQEVELPFFNFTAKKREYREDRLLLAPNEVLIVEGIHGLNPELTHAVPAARKFKIYISALTQLNIDSGNRISTTDNRLMRRIIRDYLYRGNSPLVTLGMWPSVRRGEKTWIFPFQSQADVAFNSALDYELAVLKPMLEPLLLTVKPSMPEYAEVRRLQGFLSNFLGAPDITVPATSILREYIGASNFEY